MKTKVAVVVLFLTLCSLSALVSVSKEGLWPKSWPAELEPFRKQARTVDVGTALQQHIYEIPLSGEDEFSKVWSALSKVRTPHSPVTLSWTNDPSPKAWGDLLSNRAPGFRIYAPLTAFEEDDFSLKKLQEAQKLMKTGEGAISSFETHVYTNGALPEFAKKLESNGKHFWIPTTLDYSKTPEGFVFSSANRSGSRDRW